MRKRINLTRLSRVTRSRESTHYGDPCPCSNCRGHIGVYCTQRADGITVRWLECRACGFKPADSKWTVPVTEEEPPLNKEFQSLLWL